MEELLIALLQFCFEVLFEILAHIPWEVADPIGGLFDREYLPLSSAIAGAALGGLSLLVAPTTFLHRGPYRIATLLGTPIVSGLIAANLARIRLTRAAEGRAPAPKRERSPVRNFWCAFLFTLAIATIRFTYATRSPADSTPAPARPATLPPVEKAWHEANHRAKVGSLPASGADRPVRGGPPSD